MKAAVTLLVLGVLSRNAFAKPPSQQLVDSCLITERTSKRITYRDIDSHWFVGESKDRKTGKKKTSVSVEHGKESLGLWETGTPPTYGLVYNDKEIALRNVIRLDKRHVPSEFAPYTASWGVASEGPHSYFCVTFNFGGIGSSGSFQNFRGLYLIDRKARPFKAYYTAGDIRKIKK